eukprot:2670945-Amphidinium_carterae.1
MFYTKADVCCNSSAVSTSTCSSCSASLRPLVWQAAAHLPRGYTRRADYHHGPSKHKSKSLTALVAEKGCRASPETVLLLDVRVRVSNKHRDTWAGERAARSSPVSSGCGNACSHECLSREGAWVVACETDGLWWEWVLHELGQTANTSSCRIVDEPACASQIDSLVLYGTVGT